MNEWMKSKAQIMLLLTNKEKTQWFKNNRLPKDSCYIYQHKHKKNQYFEFDNNYVYCKTIVSDMVIFYEK